MKKFMLVALFVGALVFTSCGSDDDGGSSFSCANAVTDASNAGTAYSEDPSVANCNSYKSALQDLLDEGCVEGAEAATQALIDALTCE